MIVDAIITTLRTSHRAGIIALALSISCAASAGGGEPSDNWEVGQRCCDPDSLFERRAIFTWPSTWGGTDEDLEAEQEPEEEGPLDLDRPDFTEASTTVGRGRKVLEFGYTYSLNRNGDPELSAHSFPELLLRVGMFADWFEIRVGQNFGSQQTTDVFGSFSDNGAEDLYLGSKLQLTEQKGWLPEMVLIPQMTVPSGGSSFTGNETLAGVNWIYGWAVTEWLSLGGSSQMNQSIDSDGERYWEIAQSFVADFPLTEKLGSYVEWFAFFPHGASAATFPQYYGDAGLAYLVNNNFQLDIRVGLGLNNHADDFFTGTGGGFRW
ncbi:MAG: transporter [Hyphomicrobiaceae bacterium]